MPLRFCRITSVVLCLSGFVCLGCGGDGLDRVPITGLVTMEGTPLAGASLYFVPGEGTPGEGAIGASDKEGYFKVISSRRDDSGIPPGEYTVRVSRLVMPDGTAVPPDAPDADFPESRESIPKPYSGMNSPLKVTISADGGGLEVNVPAKPIDPKAKKKK